jgi:uncharacterized protein YndB with AHSA1/START domain
MSRPTSPDPASFDCVVEIAAPPEAVFAAFFAPDDLQAWWAALRSVTTPRPLGIYAVEWATTDHADPLLGALGGVFYGTVIDVRPPREFFLADAYWLPPARDPIGPMALQVMCEPTAAGTRLRFQLDGCDDSPRWRRFYRIVNAGWSAALGTLKTHLEARQPGPPLA